MEAWEPENIEEEQTYKVIAVFSSEFMDKEKLQGQITSYRNAGANDAANNLQADYNAVQSARSAGMPIMFVDNIDDYKKAMTDLASMGSSTSVYTLNGHGSNGRFNIGETGVNEHTDFSDLADGLRDKTVFISGCDVTSGKSGKRLIQKFSQETYSTVIGKNSEVQSSYWYNGGIGLNLFGNRFQMSRDGSTATEIRNVRIHQDKGIRWKGKGY
jgi:hypothetical protein